MSNISNQSSKTNSVNRAGPVGEVSSSGRCSLVQQRGPGRHPTTVRRKWSKNVNKIVMECFLRSKLWNVSLEVSFLMMKVSQLEDTGDD